MRLKASGGVKLGGVKPEAVAAMAIADSVYESFGVDLVLTSVKDGKHKVTSLHRRGLAFDCRLPSRSPVRGPREKQGSDEAVAMELRLALGSEFDVVLEGDHVHVEFDPKEEKATADGRR